MVLRPGETFSYWRAIGKPTRRKGYWEGMILSGGTVGKGIGSGLCQLSNLIYWMTLHTELTVTDATATVMMYSRILIGHSRLETAQPACIIIVI